MKLALAAVLICVASASASAADLTIFAAASMTEAVQKLASGFEAETGASTRISLAASSVLARQIENGAPADIFISANRGWVDHLEARDALQPGSRRVIARNRLVVVARSGVPLRHLDDLKAARIAMGDPAHVPAGLYARQALTHLDLWTAIQAQLIPAANTRAAVSFVERGAARFGIAYRTDALAFPNIDEVHAFPENSHDPIQYEAAVTGHGARQAMTTDFISFILSPTGQGVLAGFGFTPVRAN